MKDQKCYLHLSSLPGQHKKTVTRGFGFKVFAFQGLRQVSGGIEVQQASYSFFGGAQKAFDAITKPYQADTQNGEPQDESVPKK